MARVFEKRSRRSRRPYFGSFRVVLSYILCIAHDWWHELFRGQKHANCALLCVLEIRPSIPTPMSTTRTNRLLLASSCALALILALCGPTLFRTFNSGLAPMCASFFRARTTCQFAVDACMGRSADSVRLVDGRRLTRSGRALSRGEGPLSPLRGQVLPLCVARYRDGDAG
jgi:hypothetical protein